MSRQVDNLAMGYTTGDDEKLGGGPRRQSGDMPPSRGGPAGGGYSTVEDLLKFHLALRDGKLINTKSLELLSTTKTGAVRGGCGFMVMQANGWRQFGHNGGAPGIAAATLTRFLASLLYGVKPLDPVTFLAAPAMLAVVALLACVVPALHAAGIAPSEDLRHE